MSRDCYRCRECGAGAARWEGRCPRCGEWNSLEAAPPPAPGRRPRPVGAADAGADPVRLGEVASHPEPALPTGIAELDRVLGGGLVRGSVTLVAGEPGIGKSTLLLQMLDSLAGAGSGGLLVSAEESPAQVASRARRLGGPRDGVWTCPASDLASIRAAVARVDPAVLVVDSIQMITDPATPAAAGSVQAVRSCAAALGEDAKAGGPATVLAGHVTKEGTVAGPRVLEHLVDTVLYFEGDRHHSLRVLRAVKHRFGPVGETGIWEMGQAGLSAVDDPARLLLSDRDPSSPGSVVLAALDGRRPLLVEVQALVSAAPAGAVPRRSASGYDNGRLSQVLAVLDRRAGLSLGRSDVYVSVTGGVRLRDPGADLAVAMAVASAATGTVVDADLAVAGEIGLGGEVRQVAHLPARLCEAGRAGFAGVLTPPAPAGTGPARGAASVAVASLAEAVDGHLRRAAPPARLRVVGGGPPWEQDGDARAGHPSAGASREAARAARAVRAAPGGPP